MDVPRPPGPRWHRMCPLKDRGQAMIIDPHYNPFAEYCLSDSDVKIIRQWVPDFDPDRGGWNLPAIEGLLLTRFKIAAESCQQLSWPQIVAILRSQEPTHAENESRSLTSLIARGRELMHACGHPTDAHSDFENWDSAVGEWLDQQFPNAWYSATWSAVSTSPLVVGNEYYSGEAAWAKFRWAVQRRLKYLAEIGAKMQAKTQNVADSGVPVNSNRVFLVHGHDNAMKQQVARIIERLGLNPVILHEQANEGKTIIEKFEKHADVGFAVILCSADDTGYANCDGQTKAKSRPRQNVVLELGYFIGKLGRARVCALCDCSPMELPSDINGVIYTPFDSNGGWKTELVRELKAAGYSVDANKLI